MNLFLLLEGDRTEPALYRAWLQHTFPELRQVAHLSNVTSNCYVVFRGGGYPSYLRRIRASLAEIAEHPSMDHFFVCVDSEDRSYNERLAEVEAVVREAAHEARLSKRHPGLRMHVIVQHCCIETWLLGHSKMLKRNPTSERLVAMKRHHDVSVDCPERMGAPAGYLTRASFHLAYLQEMFRERGLSYTKEHPGTTRESHYLEALRQRCVSTGHLPSLSVLLSTWDGMR